MTQNKKQFTSKDKKKLLKETKDVRGAKGPEEATPEPRPWKILSKFPPRVAKKEAEHVKGAAKRVAAKKKKLHSKHSKRTTPGQVEQDITPYAHAQRSPETKKTVQNIENQVLAKGRRLTKKLSKTKK